jgi:hypothetical protein
MPSATSYSGGQAASFSTLRTIFGRIIIFGFIIILALYAGLFSGKVDVESIIIQILIISWLMSGPLCDWLLGRVDVLDPVSLLCLFGLHYFVFGPIYQLNLSYWPFLPWSANVEAYVPSWYWWQAAMISLSFLILKLIGFRDGKAIGYKTIPVIAFSELPFILVVATFIVKLATIVMLGGFSGIIASYQARIDGGGVSENNTFAGLGVVISIGNAFPIAFGYWFINLYRNKPWIRSRVFLVFFASSMFAITFAANGLMGSRANVIYAVVIVL